MKLETLVVSRSSSCVDSLLKLAHEMGMATRVFDDTYLAMDKLAQRSYAAVLQDLDVPGAHSMLRFVHLIPAANRPVSLALVGIRKHVETAYEAGANFVLYKPVRAEQAVRVLRAARGFMHAERRWAGRQPARQLLHFDLPAEVCCPALLLDVSEAGIAIQTIGPLPLKEELPFRLKLPSGARIQGRVEPVWADSKGRAGLMFADLSLRDRHNLESWLRRHALAPQIANKSARAAGASG